MLLIETGGTSSFGSSTMFSLDSESEGIETSSVVSDVVSISGSVIVKTCSDSLFSIGQKNCQLFVAKLRNFLDSHNRMVLY